MKRFFACMLMCVMMVATSGAALADECSHEHTQHIKYVTSVTNVVEGHEYRTYEKVYCNDCETSVSILKSAILEGHSFDVYDRDHYSTPSGDYDVTIYRCGVCGHTTNRSNPCDGSCFPVYQ